MARTPHLPVQGSETQWYKNVVKNRQIRIDARDEGAEFRAAPVTDSKAVRSVVEKFREKYGAQAVKLDIRFIPFVSGISTSSLRWGALL